MAALKDIDASLGTDTKGNLLIYTGIDAVKEMIRNLIYTEKQEIIMDPAQGSLFSAMIHEDITEDNAFLIRSILRDRIEKGTEGTPVTEVQIQVRPDTFYDSFNVVITFLYDKSKEVLTETIQV